LIYLRSSPKGGLGQGEIWITDKPMASVICAPEVGLLTPLGLRPQLDFAGHRVPDVICGSAEALTGQQLFDPPL
jgi:hypothetical protein